MKTFHLHNSKNMDGLTVFNKNSMKLYLDIKLSLCANILSLYWVVGSANFQGSPSVLGPPQVLSSHRILNPSRIIITPRNFNALMVFSSRCALGLGCF